MADSYDAAAQQIDEQKRALLAAMAQSGSQGRQAFEQSQAELSQQRQAATAAALAEASRRGAPQAMLDSVAYTVSSPYDMRAADMTASNASRQASLAQSQAGFERYMGEAAGAIPAMRAISERQKAELQAKAEREAAQDAMQMKMKQMDLEIAKARLTKEMQDAEEEEALESDPLRMLIKRFGGIKNANDHIAGQWEPYAQEAKSFFRERATGVNPSPGGLRAVETANYEDMRPTEDYYDEFDDRVGLPAGYSRGIARNYAPKESKGTAGEREDSREAEVLSRAQGKTREAIVFAVDGNSDLAGALADLDRMYREGRAEIMTPSGKARLDRRVLENYLRQYYGG